MFGAFVVAVEIAPPERRQEEQRQYDFRDRDGVEVALGGAGADRSDRFTEYDKDDQTMALDEMWHVHGKTFFAAENRGDLLLRVAAGL